MCCPRRTGGCSPESKTAGAYFLGTEPAQYRAERVFFWSIEQVRDPSRIYEIYLMKDLVGFDRRRWLTGFTNYRLAIPDFAGGFGRAIYNDVDQVYSAIRENCLMLISESTVFWRSPITIQQSC